MKSKPSVIFAIVVIYNTKAKSCPSINTLDKINEYSTIVVDNSTDNNYKKENVEYCKSKSILYIDALGNQGLSRAYNLAIEKVAAISQSNDIWVMTLDQDTIVDKPYLINIIESIKNNKSATAIKSGKIFFNDNNGSPSKILPYKPIKKQGNVWLNAECINSCLTIRLRELLSVGKYDERLFLDQVDKLILYKLRNAGHRQIEIVDGNIYQDFSGNNFTTKKSDMHRFKIYKKDTLHYIAITKDRIFIMLFDIIKRWLHIQIHYLLRLNK